MTASAAPDVGPTTAAAPWSALRAWLSTPTDGASLAAFRILFGLGMAAAQVRFVAKGWVEELYVAPTFHFAWWGFGWVRPLPGAAMYLPFAAMFALGLGIAAGWRTRALAAAFALVFAYVEVLDQTTYLNHYVLVTLLALWLAAIPTDGGPVPRWALAALRGQVGVVYFFAGVAKLGSDWLLHAQPLRLWLANLVPAGLVDPLGYAMAWGGAAFDLAIPFLLLDRRTRLPAWLVLAFFHLVTGALFHIGIFPVLMVAASSVFFEPDWPRRLPGWPAAPARAVRPISSGGAAALLAIAAIELLFPLRNRLYPGEPLWHEQGFRLGWRVLLVEKTGFVEFEVRDPATGRVWRVDPGEELTPMQAKSMSTQPDLLLAYAHHLRDRFAADGVAPVEVRADAWATLNGRRPQRLLDPDVDLARERQTFWNQPFILPLEPGSPP